MLSWLGDLINFRFRWRADQREERTEKRASRQDLLQLIDQHIDNTEKALALVTDEKARAILQETILSYRALKGWLLEQEIQSHPAMPIDRAPTLEAPGGIPSGQQIPASQPTVKIGSATVEPGGSATVAVTAVPPPAGIGAYTVDVLYERVAIVAVDCTSNDAGVCNHRFGPNMVRFVGASATGLTGEVTLGTIRFQASTKPASSVLRVNVEVLVDPYLRDLLPDLAIISGTLEISSA